MSLPRVTRRQVVLGLMAASALGGCAVAGRPRAASGRFLHGVASGDPGADSVVIWTRVTPPEPAVVEVTWEVATDPGFERIVRRGTTVTADEIDYTVKAVVESLQPGTTYHYRFRVGDVSSPVGRTRALPAADAARARLAVVSCSHYSFGHYNVYREIAALEQLDAVVHLGDYIYESSADGSGSDYGAERGRQLGRVHDPAHTAVTLDDYRGRYAQYRGDADLQAVHARHPFILVWDDHELANDAWSDGAQAHDVATQGSFRARRDAALQALLRTAAGARTGLRAGAASRSTVATISAGSRPCTCSTAGSAAARNSSITTTTCIWQAAAFDQQPGSAGAGYGRRCARRVAGCGQGRVPDSVRRS
ncbi:MAG: alkaline phosphatase D family protein [Woeseiaceae bacterium]|nr:alkaline phosphatase D family protein [Woeseiaceae bacterium]